MPVEEELKQHTPDRDTWLSIGVFDGLHLGHQHLLRHLLESAASSRALSGVVTFRQHPRKVLSSQTPLTYLASLEERLRLLKGLGVELVVAISFTPELAQLSARDFLGLLMIHLRMKGLVVGPNFALGRGREGNVAALRRLAPEMGFQLVVALPLAQDGVVVSSTAIRRALDRGAMDSVSRMLGRPYSLEGPVVPGVERGRTLGFPTANIAVNHDKALPADGVYATIAHVAEGSQPAVTNIGQRPTFGGGERTVEVFLLDFSGDLYGQELRIELVERLRGEKRFTSPQELQAQIARDAEQARSRLRSPGGVRG